MAVSEREKITNEGRYQALLGVSEAIVSQRDFPALFHELAERLGQVVSFDYLSLVLHDPEAGAMRLHVAEASERLAVPEIVLRAEDDPAGLVWQTQRPLITASVAELARWPLLLERVRGYDVQSYCWLPLTTARRRLGTLVFTSKQVAPTPDPTCRSFSWSRTRWPSPSPTRSPGRRSPH
jgi:formate hydrogenlyase transcriptional activator